LFIVRCVNAVARPAEVEDTTITIGAIKGHKNRQNFCCL